MGGESIDDDDCYYRAAVITSEHPEKPLDGTVVAISSPHDVSIDESVFEALIEQAENQFTINSYATELRLGTIYFDATNPAMVGVSWEDSPLVYDHGDLNEPVGVLPDTVTRPDDLLGN